VTYPVPRPMGIPYSMLDPNWYATIDFWDHHKTSIGYVPRDWNRIWSPTRCTECRYNMEGLELVGSDVTGVVCPECGVFFRCGMTIRKGMRLASSKKKLERGVGMLLSLLVP
jgi:hypothetical protein